MNNVPTPTRHGAYADADETPVTADEIEVVLADLNARTTPAPSEGFCR